MAGMKSPDEDQTAGMIWERLQAREGAWRTPLLATADSNLGADARTIVLRECDPASRELVFYTARDAGKVGQLSLDSRCCLVIHAPDAAIQVRLYGHGRQVSDQAWLDRAWQALDDWQQEVYALQRRISGWENFTACRVTVHAMHLLRLHPDGLNEATEFHWHENAAGEAGGGWTSKAVVP